MLKNIIISGIILIILIGCKIDQTGDKDGKQKAEYWMLNTGSKIAYAHITADKPANDDIPVVFVHGGPGACQVKGYLEGRGKEWFRHLAGLGFNIYLYDQIGSGLSARLTDPGEYTVARHAADLEEIRKTIGGKKVILIGESWGATLVSHYMAAYPHNVIKAIFISPGRLNPIEWLEHDEQKQGITFEFMDWLYNNKDEKTIKRFTEAEPLILTSPKEAYKKLPDSFVDTLLDEFTLSVLPNTVYDKNLVNGSTLIGMGWWSYIMTNFDAVSIPKDKTATLLSDRTPVLIMRGDNDYLEPEIADQYRAAFSNSRLLNIENAGHLIWLDRPEVYAETIENFLLEKNYKK